MLQVKVTEGVSGHAADFLQRTATGPSCGKSIHVPHLRALRGCSLVSSNLLKSRKLAACLETPHVQKPPHYLGFRMVEVFVTATASARCTKADFKNQLVYDVG